MTFCSQKLIENIKKDSLVVLPTDTLYGIHASALSVNAVEKVYKIRQRCLDKPMIILIGSIEQLSLFDIKIDSETKKILKKYWPGKISIILPCKDGKYKYLHRGKKTLAFRLPNKSNLIELLKKTGPLVSTSVNPERKRPAKTIEEAKAYFGKKIDLYLDEGKLDSLPSTLISIKKGKIKVLRKGEVKINITHI